VIVVAVVIVLYMLDCFENNLSSDIIEIDVIWMLLLIEICCFPASNL
jgi:hypothetical protein